MLVRTTGMVFGDPHFITFDGTMFTFNAWGEFWLVRVTDSLTPGRYSADLSGDRRPSGDESSDDDDDDKKDDDGDDGRNDRPRPPSSFNFTGTSPSPLLSSPSPSPAGNNSSSGNGSFSPRLLQDWGRGGWPGRNGTGSRNSSRPRPPAGGGGGGNWTGGWPGVGNGSFRGQSVDMSGRNTVNAQTLFELQARFEPSSNETGT